MLKPDQYEIYLRRYLVKNPHSTEADFLEEKIAETDSRIEGLKEEKKNHCLKNNIPYLMSESYVDFKKYPQHGSPEVCNSERHSGILREINHRLSSSENFKKDYEIRLNRLPQINTRKKSGQISGKKLNLSERFEIANKYSNLWGYISDLEVPEMKKYEILSVVLGCSPDNARKVVSGNYDSKNRPELIAKFYRDIENGQK